MKVYDLDNCHFPDAKRQYNQLIRPNGYEFENPTVGYYFSELEKIHVIMLQLLVDIYRAEDLPTGGLLVDVIEKALGDKIEQLCI